LFLTDNAYTSPIISSMKYFKNILAKLSRRDAEANMHALYAYCLILLTRSLLVKVGHFPAGYTDVGYRPAFAYRCMNTIMSQLKKPSVSVTSTIFTASCEREL